MPNKIPVYILTGFLGAGKTTLLQTLLRVAKAEGSRPAVLMNEFGKASVDTLLLQEAAVPVVDLIEGCVCCTVKGSLTAAMEELLDTHQPDLVFLEATGVAIPLEIIDALLDPPLASRVQIAGVLACVDATQFPLQLPPLFEQTPIQQTMAEQVRHADVILLTKTDVAKPDRRFALEGMLRGLNRQAKLVKAVKGAVDAKEVLHVRRVERKKVAIAKRAGGVERVVPSLKRKTAETSFGTLDTLHVRFENPIDADKLYELLYSLPEGILRAKGFFTNADTGETYDFHYVPRTPMMGPISQPMENFAIFIGEGLEEADVERKLAACERK